MLTAHFNPMLFGCFFWCRGSGGRRRQAASRFDLSNFGNIYSRLSNPTTAVLEERVATLEGGRGATCTSSGHAAQLLTLFTLMQVGVGTSDKKRAHAGKRESVCAKRSWR